MQHSITFLLGTTVQSVSPAQHPLTMTPPPAGFMVGSTHTETIRSPSQRLTNPQRLALKIFKISTVQRRRRESGPIWCRCCKDTTTEEEQQQDSRELLGARNNNEWTLDQWKSRLRSNESKFEIFGGRMVSVDPTMKHAEGGVMVCVWWG